MPQISFTPRNSDVYDRFSRLLLEEQLKRGKLTAPQFLDLVLDAFEEKQQGGFVIRHKENHCYFVLDKRHAANPDAKFTFKQLEALVFDTEFEAEDFGFINSDWLQDFEVAPFELQTK